MSNEDLQVVVGEELYWDPTVDSEAIAVSATAGGAITLRGTVGSLREKRQAQRAARRVGGVKSVENELQVRLLTRHLRRNADLRAAVLQALMLDAVVPSTVDVRAFDGWVTLTGTAEWQHQREEAELIAGNVLGVLGVVDEIELENPRPKPADVRRSIETALARNASIDRHLIAVITYNSTVALAGIVHSWPEHDEAIAAAWAVPGVTQVDDRIVVD